MSLFVRIAGMARGTRGRVALGVGLLALTGAGGALAGGNGTPARAPGGSIDGLLADATGGKIVVDASGKPVLGRDGRPLRVAADGRTLVDAAGNPLRDKGGRPIRVTPGAALPAAARRHVTPTPTPSRRTRTRRAKPRKPRAPVTHAAREPIVVGSAAIAAESHNAYYASVGWQQRAENWNLAAKAVVDWINADGGVKGRPFKLRTEEYDPAAGGDYYTVYEALCARFAQGEKPVAVISPMVGVSQRPCWKARGIPVVSSWVSWAHSVALADRRGFLFGPGAALEDGVYGDLVDSLVATGWLTRQSKVGLLTSDGPLGAPERQAIKQAFERHGIAIAEEKVFRESHEIKQTAGAQDEADFREAALRFKLRGVDRVFATGSMTYFALLAHELDYHPRYALTTQMDPMMIAASAKALGLTRELEGAAGIGWAPIVDVAAQDEGPINATRARCEAIFAAAGTPLGSRTSFGQYAAYSMCDGLLALRAALSRSPDVQAGMEALGTDHQSAVTMQTQLGAGRHAGAAAYRLLRFDGERFRYEGPVKPFK